MNSLVFFSLENMVHSAKVPYIQLDTCVTDQQHLSLYYQFLCTAIHFVYSI
jgi:hypothetical protein